MKSNKKPVAQALAGGGGPARESKHRSLAVAAPSGNARGDLARFLPRALLVIPLCLLLALAAGCRDKKAADVKAAAPSVVRARLLRVEAEPFALSVTVTGTLVSTSRVDVKAETTGRLLRLPKQEGDRVEAGEAVAWVEDETYRLALGQAEAAAAVAAASVERARVVEAHSLSELERAKNLLASGGITDKDMKSAELAARDARAQVALAEAQLSQAHAAVALERKRLADTVIHAPVSGEIQRKHVNPGAYVEPPTALLTLVDNRRLELESPLASADLGKVRPGQRVSFAVNSYPGEVFSGTVIEIGPAVDADTRAVKVRVGVDNPARRLKTGMFAQGEILTGTRKDAILVPLDAIQRGGHAAQETFVYVVEEGTARKRAVRTGGETDSRVEIVEGLRPGEIIVAAQSIEVADGVRVEPLE